MREDTDLQAVHGDYIGGCGGAGEALEECGFHVGVVVGDDNPDGERAKDEEGGETVEDSFEGAGHCNAGVFGLPSGDGDVVWSCDGERRLDEAGDEAHESP